MQTTVLTLSPGRLQCLSRLDRMIAAQSFLDESPDNQIVWVIGHCSEISPDVPESHAHDQIEVREVVPLNFNTRCTPEENFRENFRRVNLYLQQKTPAEGYVVFCEDDDYYTPEHVASVLRPLLEDKMKIISGATSPRWWNITARRYKRMHNPGMASLAQTAIKATLLGTVNQWLNGGSPRQMDGHLWKRSQIPTFAKALAPASTTHVGLKGYPGQTGLGIKHKAEELVGWFPDPQGKQLREWIPDGEFCDSILSLTEEN